MRSKNESGNFVSLTRNVVTISMSMRSPSLVSRMSITPPETMLPSIMANCPSSSVTTSPMSFSPMPLSIVSRSSSGIAMSASMMSSDSSRMTIKLLLRCRMKLPM